MSYPSLLQSLPSNVRQITQQPYWWPAVASLGFHALFLAALPFIPLSFSDASEPDIRRSVPMVELTPEELGRLPNASTSEPELPPIPNDDFYSFNNDFDSFNNPNLESPSKPNYQSPFLPPIPYIPPPPLFNIPLPSSPPASAPRATPTPPPQAQPTPPPQQSQPPTQDQPSDSERYARRSADDLRELDELGETAPRPNPEAQQEAARQQQMQDLLAQQQEMRNLFAYNPPDGNQINESIGEWRDRAQAAGYQEGEPISITKNYPAAIACMIKDGESERESASDDPITAIYGVFINPQNQFVEEPQLLLSSGYEYFNRQALEAIANHSFENESGAVRTYTVTVEFQAESGDCPENGAPNQPVGSEAGGNEADT
ncbi:MAG: energy transducer TonB family protein [Elainellaceae cyanobacterium]